MESDRAKFAGKISKRPEQIWARPTGSIPIDISHNALCQEYMKTRGVQLGWVAVTAEFRDYIILVM